MGLGQPIVNNPFRQNQKQHHNEKSKVAGCYLL